MALWLIRPQERIDDHSDCVFLVNSSSEPKLTGDGMYKGPFVRFFKASEMHSLFGREVACGWSWELKVSFDNGGIAECK